MRESRLLSDGSSGREKIRFSSTFYGKYRVLALFSVLLGLVIAAFSVSGVWLQRGATSAIPPDRTLSTTDGVPQTTAQASNETSPSDGIVICGMDLSYSALGETYLINETSYLPQLDDWRARSVCASPAALASGGPLVLILHTHSREAYLEGSQSILEGDLGALTYSNDTERSVVAVGKALCDALNQKGIQTIHCTVAHDADTLGGAYQRAAQSIRFYLSLYPSIEYVIDLHRDSILSAEGTYIKTEAPLTKGSCAQIAAVVGMGEMHREPERVNQNLALALGLRAELNRSAGLARPVILKNSSYNQELSKYSLLLEIGTGGNTVDEALNCVDALADALERLILSP